MVLSRLSDFMIPVKALLTRSTLVYRFLSLILTGLNVLKVQSFTRIFVSYFGKVIHRGAGGLNLPPSGNLKLRSRNSKS